MANDKIVTQTSLKEVATALNDKIDNPPVVVVEFDHDHYPFGPDPYFNILYYILGNDMQIFQDLLTQGKLLNTVIKINNSGSFYTYSKVASYSTDGTLDGLLVYFVRDGVIQGIRKNNFE